MIVCKGLGITLRAKGPNPEISSVSVRCSRDRPTRPNFKPRNELPPPHSITSSASAEFAKERRMSNMGSYSTFRRREAFNLTAWPRVLGCRRASVSRAAGSYVGVSFTQFLL
jgi:hypothetical protein